MSSEDMFEEGTSPKTDDLITESWEQLKEEIEAVHRGEVPEYRAIDMELVWKCTKCGALYPRDIPPPENCPKCGAPEADFVAVIED